MRIMKMPIETLRNVKGAEFPRTWVERLHLNPDRTYDIEIKSKGEEEAIATKEKGEDFDVTKDPVFLIEGYDIVVSPDASANVDQDLYGGPYPA